MAALLPLPSLAAVAVTAIGVANVTAINIVQQPGRPGKYVVRVGASDLWQIAFLKCGYSHFQRAPTSLSE